MPEPNPGSYRAGTCETCGKLRYRSRRAAQQDVRATGDDNARAYRCGAYWHVGGRQKPVLPEETDPNGRRRRR